MLYMIALLATLASGVGPSTGPCPGPDPDYKALYESGTPVEIFMGQAKARRALWERNQNYGEIPDALLESARAHVRTVQGPTYLLAVAVDACSDSVNTIPYLARLAAAVDGLELRIIPPDAGREIMEAHRTPDGRAATPTVVVLDADFNEIGVFIERPAPLQEWALTAGADLDSGTFVKEKGAWYDEDAGRTTIEEVLAIMERKGATQK
ncbi:MAG: thioredoxin family protein [Rhodothermales bacterium]